MRKAHDRSISRGKQAGQADWLLAFALITLAVCWIFPFGNDQEKTGQLKEELTSTRLETAEETSVADAAEKLPTPDIARTLWLYAGPDGMRKQLLLKPDGTFVASVSNRPRGIPETASGTYQLRGSVLVFSRKEGAAGLFPSSGRIAITASDADHMTLGGKQTFKTQARAIKDRKERVAEEEKSGDFIRTLITSTF